MGKTEFMAHLPGWAVYPLLPLFVFTTIRMFAAKRRELLWLSAFVLVSFALERVDYESLGLRGEFFHVFFITVTLVVVAAWRIQRVLTVGEMLSMDAKDWQKEFDEANRALKQKAKKKESNG